MIIFYGLRAQNVGIQNNFGFFLNLFGDTSPGISGQRRVVPVIICLVLLRVWEFQYG